MLWRLMTEENARFISLQSESDVVVVVVVVVKYHFCMRTAFNVVQGDITQYSPTLPQILIQNA